MLVKVTTTALILSILPSTLAATSCTKSNALDWSTYTAGTGSGSSSGSSDDACANLCNDGSAASVVSKCLTACYAQAQAGQCASVGCDSSDDDSDSSDDKKKIKRDVDVLAKKALEVIEKRIILGRSLAKRNMPVRLGKRATLECESKETCYLYTDGSLLCLDPDTGVYHDDVDGTGNANTGVYTYSDGYVTTILAGETAAPRTAAASASATGSDDSSSSASGRSTTATRTGSATATRATAAGASGTSSAGKLGTDALIGALGLLAGLIL